MRCARCAGVHQWPVKDKFAGQFVQITGLQCCRFANIRWGRCKRHATHRNVVEARHPSETERNEKQKAATLNVGRPLSALVLSQRVRHRCRDPFQARKEIGKHPKW